MKKGLVLGMCALTVALTTSVQAIELKAPNVGALKNAVSTSTTTTKANDEKAAAFQKAFQSSIDTANKSLANANTMSSNAIWALGDIILDKETMDAFKNKKSEATTYDELLKALNAKLKDKAFDSSNLTANNAQYVQAATNLQIASNRYENIMNNISPNFKKVLDGEASIFAVKSQLIESGKLTKNVQTASLGQNAVLRKIRKINANNSVYINIPATEKVQYNKDGVVGSINYQLDTINNNVDKSYQELITAFNLKDKIAAEKAKIANDNTKSPAEKDAAIKKFEEDALTNGLKESLIADANGNIQKLTTQQATAIANASGIMIDSLANYTALGLACTKLGMQISAKPILAAPLALEVGQLKYTAKVIKDSATSLKNVSGQVIKVAKANNIKVKSNDSKAGATKKVNLKF